MKTQIPDWIIGFTIGIVLFVMGYILGATIGWK